MPFMQLKDLLRWFDHTWAEFEFRSVHNSICNGMYSDGMQYVNLCVYMAVVPIIVALGVCLLK